MTRVAEDERWSQGRSAAGCSGPSRSSEFVSSPGDPLCLLRSLGQSRPPSLDLSIPRKEPDSNAHLLAYQGLHPNAQNRACLLSGPREHLRKDETLRSTHSC